MAEAPHELSQVNGALNTLESVQAGACAYIREMKNAPAIRDFLTKAPARLRALADAFEAAAK